MQIEVKPPAITCQEAWNSKYYGVVFVEREEHIEPVFKALCEQDDYWENCKKLIQIAPKEVNSISDLNEYCEYVGKTDIYKVPKLKSDLRKQGIEFMLYQYSLPYQY